MPRYLLNVYQPPGELPPERLEPIMRDVEAVRDDLKAAGGWVLTAGLLPPSASRVVRADGEDTVVSDGPFTEAKEFVGGFTVMEADDEGAALEWAGRFARATTLPIEVRPLAG